MVRLQVKKHKPLMTLAISLPGISVLPVSTHAAALPTSTVQLLGQVSSSLFFAEPVPLPMPLPPNHKAVLGVDVYHVTSPSSFNILLMYAWIYEPPDRFAGQVFPLRIYVDNEMMSFVLNQEFQGQVPVILVDNLDVNGRNKKDGSIVKVQSRLKDDNFRIHLNSRSMRREFPGETVAMQTPTGSIIEVVINPGKWAFTTGYITGYRFVFGIAFNSDFMLRIYTP